MAITEDLSAYSTTQASNTPAGTDNVGPDLDDHLRNIKKNVTRVARSRFGEAIGDIERITGGLWADNSATPVTTLNYDSGIGMYPLFNIDQSASGVTPYIDQTLMGGYAKGFNKEQSTASAKSNMEGLLKFSAVTLGFATATDTAALHLAIGVGTSAGDLPELITGSATSIAALPVLSAENLTDIPVDAAITRETAQATTSGTAFNFTGIAAGANRITVMFSGVSLSGTDQLLVQLGDAGGLETTGYDSVSLNVTSTSGFIMQVGVAASTISGVMYITRIDGNEWIETCVIMHDGTANEFIGAGSKTLTAELTQLTLTRDGTDTFDAGQVNIMYE